MVSHFDMQHQIDETENRRDFLRKAFMAVWVNMITGDYAEFGCCGATTFRLAHQASRGNLLAPHLWAFDSFKGLPHGENEHPRWLRGAMSMDREQFIQILDFHGIDPKDYTIIEGYYSDTLPASNSQNICKDIAVAYIDCDMYESTRQVLEFLESRLKHGMIIALDDYYCWWANGVSGERIAFLELERKVRSEFNFLPLYNFGWHGQSFVVEARRFLKGFMP
jgi:O-methyltransferase